MEITKFIYDGLLKVRVIPNASQKGLKEEEGKLRLYLKSVPEKNKANFELVKFFKKKFDLRVEIISGKKSREKVLRVY